MAITIPKEMFGKYHNKTGQDIHLDLSGFSLDKIHLDTITDFLVEDGSFISITDINNINSVVDRDIQELILFMKKYFNDVVWPDPTYGKGIGNRPRIIEYQNGLV